MSDNIYIYRNTEVIRTDEFGLHMDRMTREGLHSKSEIAAELAGRDRTIRSERESVGMLKLIVQQKSEQIGHVGSALDKAYDALEVERKKLAAYRDAHRALVALAAKQPDKGFREGLDEAIQRLPRLEPGAGGQGDGA